MKNIKQHIATLAIVMATFASGTLTAQEAIGTNNPNPDAALDIDTPTKGLLIPRVALTGTANVAPLSAHVAGMTVYNTATVADVTPGYYVNDGTQWTRLASGASGDATDDAWVNNNANTRVELGTLSDGTTIRTPDTGFYIGDDASIGIGIEPQFGKGFYLSHLAGTMTINDTNGPSRIELRNATSTPASGTTLARQRFIGNNSIDEDINYAQITGKAEDTTDGSENGSLTFNAFVDGSITSHMYMADGNVGIGTTSPNEKLEVNGKVRVSDLTGTDAATDVIVTADATTGELKDLPLSTFDATDDAWVNNNTNTRIELGTQSDGTTARAAGTEFVALNNGNVGIGRANPLTKLHVKGAFSLNKRVIKDGDLTGWNNTLPIASATNLSGFSGHLFNVTVGFRGDKYAKATFVHNTQTGTLNRMVLEGNQNITAIRSSDNSTIEFYTDISSGPTSDIVVLVEMIVTNSSYITETININPGSIAITGGVNHTEFTSGTHYFAGNVGIGITTPAEKLDVVGNIKASGNLQSGTNTYPDYVFENYFEEEATLNKNYSFNTLAEVESFIKVNKHLPGVTSINELEKTENGYNVNVTALSVQTLEKVEELFLYTIEQNKKIENLEAENKALKARLSKIEAALGIDN